MYTEHWMPHMKPCCLSLHTFVFFQNRWIYGEHIILELLPRLYVESIDDQLLADDIQMMIGTVLAAQVKPSSSADRDARLMLAKSDFDRYLDTLIRAQGTADYETIQRHRVADLEKLREQITVV